MQAAGIVVGVDEGKEFVSGVLLAGEAAIAQHLGLEGADEGLGPGVVIGVGSGRHALLQACGAQPLTKSAAAILAAAVAVEDDEQQQPRAYCPQQPRAKGTGSPRIETALPRKRHS